MNDESRCPACGQPTQADQRFCANCGQALSAEQKATSPAPQADYQPFASAPNSVGQPPPPESPRPGGSWKSSKRLRAAAVLLLLVIAGAGAAVALTAGGSSNKSADTATKAIDTQAIQARRKALAKYTKCKTSTQPLMDKLHELDSRLDVGLNYDEYTTKVGDIRVAYDQVTPAIGDQVECLTGVGIPAEAAFNQFVKASNEWGNCFDDINCSNDQVRPSLRRHWTKASKAIDSADSGLEDIKNPGG